MTSWGRNINSRPPRPASNRSPSTTSWQRWSAEAAMPRPLPWALWTTRFTKAKRRGLGGPHDGEGGVLRAWRIKAVYKGYSERALVFLPWIAMKINYFNQLWWQPWKMKSALGGWPLCGLFFIRYQIGRFNHKGLPFGRPFYALYFQRPCEVSVWPVKAKVWPSVQKHNGLFHRFNSYCWCIL